MPILTVNVGSSSVRLDLFDDSLARVASTHLPRSAACDVLRDFLVERSAPTLVAHRVVHGGTKLVRPVLIDDDTEQDIAALARLAPLHNPPALAWIRAARALLGPEVPQVAVFDTAFFAQLPAAAATYALPAALSQRYGLRRFGFHGLAHEAMWRRWRQLRPDLADGGRVITFQLGSGASAAAIRHGRALDTSMGFSPLEGLVMATRAGDLDPGLLLHLQREAGLSVDALEDLLSNRAGLMGLAGTTDMATLVSSHAPEARLALDVYCHRLRKYLGAYLAVLGGADGILFGGGVGEHVPEIRRRAVEGFDFAGIALDQEANARITSAEARVSAPGSSAEVWTLSVDEARVLATYAAALAQS